MIMPIREEILKLLSSSKRQMCVKELAEALKAKPHTIRARLHGLCAEGLIKRMGKGAYGIAKKDGQNQESSISTPNIVVAKPNLKPKDVEGALNSPVSKIDSIPENTGVEKEFSLSDIEGIGPATLEKLHAIGINTVEALAFATIKELEEIGITEKKAKELIHQCRGKLVKQSFITAAELMKLRQKTVQMLTTGSSAFDKLIGGGFETQNISEVFGEYGSGKSQIAFTACVLAQLPVEKGGLNGGVLFIDTENTFSSKRIEEIAKARNLDPTQVLDKIVLAEAYNTEHQIFLAKHADKVIKENNVRLIIVDSLTAHFRSEYTGREMLSERQQKLNKHMHQLLRLARMFNAVVLVTNQIFSKPDQFFSKMNWDAIGGNIVAHTSGLRLRLRKASSNVRVVTLVDSSWLPWGECPIQITEKGIEDALEGSNPLEAPSIKVI